MSGQATQISNLLWKETSGVDHPANMPDTDGGTSEGWMVLKAVDVNRLQAALQEANSAVESNPADDPAVADLYNALIDADLSEAPPEVQDAALTLGEYLSSTGISGGYYLKHPATDEEAQGNPSTGGPGILKSLMSFFGISRPDTEEALVSKMLASDDIAERLAASISAKLSE